MRVAFPELAWNSFRSMDRSAASQSIVSPRTAFAVAWGFLILTAAMGLFLRSMVLWPIGWADYRHFLHAHSHIGFLGWVFNAFFAVALGSFIDRADRRAFGRLFVVMQVADLGMLVAYPIQGYGAASIAFSTLHMVCAAVFAWKLWRRNGVTAQAGLYLRASLVFMVVSGLGPLVLGPLAAAGLRESSWYTMSIYFYLHFQYNGWFVFFLLAVVVQWITIHRGRMGSPRTGAYAFWMLAVGCVVTFALSALWLDPPGWVHGLAALGAGLQLVGTILWFRVYRPVHARFATGLATTFAAVALVAFVLKILLQVLAAWPGFIDLANHRYTVIGFLHLVFLGITTPLLMAWAVEQGWVATTRTFVAGVWVFMVGAVATMVILFVVPVSGFWARGAIHALFGAAAIMLAGLVAAAPWGRGRTSPGVTKSSHSPP